MRFGDGLGEWIDLLTNSTFSMNFKSECNGLGVLGCTTYTMELDNYGGIRFEFICF